MSMRPAVSAEPADWIVRADAPWYVVAAYGPPGLESYARIAFASDEEWPDGVDDLSSWAAPDRLRWESVLTTLSTFSTTPDTIHFGLWDGDPGYRTAEPYFRNAGRRYALMTGTLSDALDRTVMSEDGTPNAYDVPHLAWPEDRAWVIAWETDEENNYSVGGSSTAIDAVLGLQGLRGVEVPYGTPEEGWRW